MTDVPDMPTTLPAEFHKYFWDIDAAKLNPSSNPCYVISRLLDKGDIIAARWVRRSFTEKLMIKTIRESENLEPWTITLWAGFYKIPLNEIISYNPSRPQVRHNVLWPYPQH